jgi:hypothetical protein
MRRQGQMNGWNLSNFAISMVAGIWDHDYGSGDHGLEFTTRGFHIVDAKAGANDLSGVRRR